MDTNTENNKQNSDVQELQEILERPKLSWIGRFFLWLDYNILSKSTKLWMYLLEALGIVAICIVMFQFDKGLKMIVDAKTQFQINQAKLFVDTVKSSAQPIATMVATICGALPTIIGVLRSLKTKWKDPKILK